MWDDDDDDVDDACCSAVSTEETRRRIPFPQLDKNGESGVNPSDSRDQFKQNVSWLIFPPAFCL